MSTGDHRITHLELVAARAWPAAETERLEGWMLRYSDGITWRANSVLPCYDLIECSLDKAIDHVIEFYEKRGTPPTFKINPESRPSNLDEELEERGFRKEMITHVQTVDLVDCLKAPSSFSVKVADSLDRDWIAAYGRLAGFDEKTLDARLKIMERIRPQTGFACVRAGGEIVGIGLGVIENHLMGLFGIITSLEHRKKGVGVSVNCALVEWAKNNGATQLYLQVEATNEPAMALYAKHGFKTAYDYWYRILR
ncbi:MAG: GNAT family N-acetyltransferase [Candidatus Thorarchaeota archaeon]|nr:GNAT family N-acetyltransferase [Candidatus Thorarchaeota archaeon]